MSPTRVIGTAPGGEGVTKLYLLDVVSGQVLRSIDYAGEIAKSGSLVTGADGAAYAAVKTSTGRRIVRISGTGFHTNDVAALKRVDDFLGVR